MGRSKVVGRDVLVDDAGLADKGGLVDQPNRRVGREMGQQERNEMNPLFRGRICGFQFLLDVGD